MKICSIEGCGKPMKARGWCSMHWYRWRNNGSPSVVQVRTRKPCIAPECENTAWSKGLCSKHLSRMRIHGKLDNPVRATVKQRFWTKVDKDGPLNPTSWDGRPLPGRCWLWLGAHNESGHGLFFPARREPIGAHRYSYEQASGSAIPDGFHLDHMCCHPPCVNPDHLEPVTPAENTRRGLIARGKETA